MKAIEIKREIDRMNRSRRFVVKHCAWTISIDELKAWKSEIEENIRKVRRHRDEERTEELYFLTLELGNIMEVLEERGENHE